MTPCAHLTNILQGSFSYKSVSHIYFLLNVCVCNYFVRISTKNLLVYCWWNWLLIFFVQNLIKFGQKWVPKLKVLYHLVESNATITVSIEVNEIDVWEKWWTLCDWIIKLDHLQRKEMNRRFLIELYCVLAVPGKIFQLCGSTWESISLNLQIIPT